MNKLLCALMILFLNQSFAQTTTSFNEDKSDPNSLKSDFEQVNVLFTGNTDISLPLYTLDVDGLKIPITLTYDPNRLKVNSAATWVGYGWNLEIPAKISRSVNAFPDDQIKWFPWVGFQLPVYTDYKYGYAFGGTNAVTGFNDNNIDYRKTTAQIATFNGMPFDFSNLTDVSMSNANAWDTEPDNYFYTLPNSSGSFVYGDNESIHTIPYNEIRIVHQLDHNLPGSADQPFFTSQGVSQYDVYDINGNHYEFGQKNLATTYSDIYKNISTCFPNLASSASPNLKYISEWLPTRITTANGREIFFTYAQENTEESFWTVYARNGNLTNDANTGKFLLTTVKNNTNRITRIETDDIIIDFIGGLARQDIVGSEALTEIRVIRKINGQTSLYKKFILNYGYFQTSADTKFQPLGVVPYASSPQPIDGSKILKLLSVNTVGLSGGSIPPYTFSYNEQYPLPCRYSVKQDLWGYFNNTATHPFPTLYIYPNKFGVDRITVFRRNDWINNSELERILPGADKSTTNDITRGTLKRIYNPFGGFTEYEFEPHSFHWGGENRLGGGMRIKTITKSDGISNSNDIVESFSYFNPSMSQVSSGTLLQYPHYGFTENSCLYGTGVLNYWEYSPTSFDYFDKYCWRLSSAIYNSGLDIFSPTIGYKTITQYTSSAGKTEMSFDIPCEYGQIVLEQKYVNNHISDYREINPSTKTVAGMLCVNQIAYDNQPDNNGIDLTPFSYYAPPAVNISWAQGNISNIKYFNATNQLLKEEIYSYKPFMGYYQQPTEVKAFKFGTIYAANVTLNNIGGTYAMDNWYYSRYKQIADIKLVLDKKHIKEYRDGTIDEETTYSYDKFSQPNRITTKQSNGNELITNRRYPIDYNIVAQISNYTNDAKGIRVLCNMNNLNEVVEEWTELKENNTIKVLKATLREFTPINNNSQVNLYRTWSTENNQPITNFLSSSINTITTPWSLSKYINYKIDFTVNERDALQKITETIDKNENLNAFIWGYHSKYCIAVVKNAGYNDVAYTSFEDLEPGNNDYGNWVASFNGLESSNSFSGRLSFDLSLASLNSKPSTIKTGKDYKISFWTTSNNISVNNGINNVALITGPTVAHGWTYYEATFTAQSPNNNQFTNIGIWGNALIDELRLYPVESTMTTYTYDPLIGMTSECDERSNLLIYQYDDLGRMIHKRDIYNNILIKYEYKIQDSDN